MAIKKFNSVAGFSVGEQDYVIDVVDDQANITANNLTVGNITSLGDIGNVKITGGSANYVCTI
jgi:molybdopterin biosynthesis enzyme